MSYASLIFEPNNIIQLDPKFILWKGQVSSPPNYNSIMITLLGDLIALNNRRTLEQWLNILKDNNETTGEHIMFIRKGHLCRHHDEQGAAYSDVMKDICEAEYLDNILLNKYPNLKYKIILILGCTKCFNQDITYKSNSENIEIYNCIHDDEARGKLFEECLFNVCNSSNTR